MSRTRLPHLLPPSAYFAPAHHEAERAAIFWRGWHFVTTAHELARRSRRAVRSILGAKVTVEARDDGSLHAVAQDLDRRRGAPCRAAWLGPLAFVSLSDDGPSLDEHLGARTRALGESLFSRAHRLVVATEIEHPCNWKIPLENVLESYHVPSLHDNALARRPDLFKVFSGHPDGPFATVHELDALSTTYRDSLGAESAAYRALVRWIQPSASVDYLHHHAFPNVVFGATSIVRFLSVVHPLSPTRSSSSIRLFLDLGRHALVSRAVGPALTLAARALIGAVLREDAAVYPDVQRGMEASDRPGVLGAREERIHHFHAYLGRALAARG